MSTDPQPPGESSLPARPSLRHLKDQAKDLLKTGAAKSITDAQFKIARLYGFASWPKLKAHVESFDALWHGHFPIIFAPCESMDPAALKWLLDHGANPNCRDPRQSAAGDPYPGTALDYLVASYARSAQRLSSCIDILLDAGGETRYDAPAVLQLLRGRLDGLAELIAANPALVNERFAELDCGMTGGRRLTLQGGTLLHVAAEYGNPAAVALLLDRGADVNATASVDDAGIGGQTAIFHAVTQLDDGGLPVTQLLIERGADLKVRAKLPGDYERRGEIVECTALGYARLVGGASQRG